MNKTLAITIIALVAVIMGMGAIAPALAQPDIQADGNRRGHDSGTPLKWNPDTCTRSPSGTVCVVWIDVDRNGCDRGDKTILMPLKAIRAMGMPTCGGND